MFKYRFNYEVSVYKPNKAKGLWKYSIERIRRRENDFAIQEYLTKDGTWSESSYDVAKFRTEEKALKFAEKWAGERVTKIAMG